MNTLFQRPPRPIPNINSTARKIIVHADGAISPHAAGVGIVAQDERGELRLLANRKLPPMTNNEAEYSGLLLALELTAPFQAIPVEIRMDSEIVVYQMRGRFAVNSAALKAIHRKACALAGEFQAVTYTYVPREHNRMADALAADALRDHLWKFPP
jgi:ribonuclease H / adenosylcobalamin/alpha-ribazole phosphatase